MYRGPESGLCEDLKGRYLLQACDAMFHLCRTFEDPDITHVEGEVDPVRDLDIINEELRYGGKLSKNFTKMLI